MLIVVSMSCMGIISIELQTCRLQLVTYFDKIDATCDAYSAASFTTQIAGPLHYAGAILMDCH